MGDSPPKWLDEAESAFAFQRTDFLVNPASRSTLKRPTAYAGGLKKKPGVKLLGRLHRRMQHHQRMLAAENRRSVLIVLQAMDAAGKDSTVRRVFGPLNPATCRVTSFKAPSADELEHDYLWRVHKHTPAHGEIGVFNRSHYEDVLIARVASLVPDRVWKKRFEHINAFEQMLTDEGTTVLKFYLHVSKDYQEQRLRRRLELPEKHWKFNPADLVERERWPAYQQAFQAVFSRTTKKHSPWFVVPSERRWYRDLVIAKVVCDTLDRMNPQPPEPDFDPEAVELS